jgi:predicted RND superfamily exporter protein
MGRYADFIIRYRVPVIIVVAIITLFLGYKMMALKLNADFSTYLRQDDPLVQQYNRIGEEFGGKSIALVLIESEQLFTAQSLEQIRKLTDAYEDMDGISYITSLANVLDFKKTEWGLEVGKLLPVGQTPQSDDELRRFKDYVLSKEMYTGNLVSEDGTLSAIMLRLETDMDEYRVARQIKAVTEKAAPLSDWPGGTKIYYGGMPFLMFSVSTMIAENFTILLPIMIGLIFFILVVGFRRLAGVFMPLAVVLVSTIWVLGLMALFGVSITLLSGVMPVILIALGSADGIHFMKRYYEERKAGEMPRRSVREAFGELGMPMIMTTVTTMIGFISLVISDFSVIREFGFVTALGVFLALLVTFTLLPSLLSLSRARVSYASSRDKALKRPNRTMEKLGELIFRGRKHILAAAGVIVVVSALGIPLIFKDVDWSLCLQKGSDPHRADMLLREKFGGSLPVQVLVQGDAKSPVTLKTMRFLERYLETVPFVSKTQSVASVIAEMNDVMNDRYVVPETKEGVANLWLLIEDEEIMEQMVNRTNTDALIMGKLETWETEGLVEAVDQTDRFVQLLPARQVALDLETVTPDARNALLEIRKRRMTDKILWDFRKQEIDLQNNEVEMIVGAALSQTEPTAGAYAAVQKDVADYLLSEESELEVTSQETAEALAISIAEELMANGDLSAQRIEAVVRAKMAEVAAEDASLLSESLERVIFEAAGEARVNSTLQALEEISPAGQGAMAGPLLQDLRKNLKGSLWEMNENMLLLAKDDYQELSRSFNLPQGEEVQIKFSHTGLAPVFHKMEKELTPTQVQSVLIALIFVVVLLSLMFRSILVGIISTVPIILTILVNFAVMGYLRIGLDSFTAMIASIAIGLGIDYTIHFTSRFKREFAIDHDELKAFKRTWSTTGVAIIINALSIGLGFAVLLLAGGQHLQRFGGLVTLTMLSSAIFTLTVLPAITMVLKPKYLRKDVRLTTYMKEQEVTR